MLSLGEKGYHISYQWISVIRCCQMLSVRPGANVLGTLRGSLDQTWVSGSGLLLCGEYQGEPVALCEAGGVKSVCISRAGNGLRRWPEESSEFSYLYTYSWWSLFSYYILSLRYNYMTVLHAV